VVLSRPLFSIVGRLGVLKMMNRIGKASLFLLWLLCFTSTLPSAGRANLGARQRSRLERLYPELRTLFLRHYPQVTSHLLDEKIHFEQDTRVFIVHESLKTGEWQDPRETRGPKRGGILCDLELREGKYNGAAVVPQTFDKRYFKLLVMAPYSQKHNAHLYLHLCYPSNVSDDFLKQFTEQVNGLEKYLD
jgi:hypothetical protein